MPSIDDLAEVLPESMMRLWKPTSKIAHRLNGRLIGGTAVAVHLQHRLSVDLDISTFRQFSGSAIRKALRRDGLYVAEDPIEAKNQFHGWVAASETAENSKLDVFRALPIEGRTLAQIRWIAPAIDVDGMPVAAPADLMALKLATLPYRAKPRDYVDIAALDSSEACTLEKGLNYFCKRFSYKQPPRLLEQIVRLLETPGVLDDDPLLQSLTDEALAYLAKRTPAVRKHLTGMKNFSTVDAALSTYRSGGDEFRASRQQNARCNKLMPIAGKLCKRIFNHQGPCSSTG